MRCIKDEFTISNSFVGDRWPYYKVTAYHIENSKMVKW